MAGKLNGTVVVLTGASSGVGRAAALAFASKGARVVVSARRAELLDSLVVDCERAGGEALAVRTDVAREEDVDALAEAALLRFGRVDVWINNAGLAVFGPFEKTTMRDHLRVIEIDLFGAFYGSRAAMRIFKQQGKGVLINMGSLDSRLSEPYMASYAAAKHGISGLGKSLRQELTLAGLHDVHVCTVMPETIDTPFFQHAGNYTGRAAKAMPPVLSPERVARAYVRLAEHPRREVFVGLAARQFWVQYLLAPGLTERLFAVMADRLQLSTDQPQPPTPGSLYEPMHDGPRISGGWKTARGVRKDTGRTRPSLPLAAAGLLFATPALIGAAAWSITRGHRVPRQ